MGKKEDSLPVFLSSSQKTSENNNWVSVVKNVFCLYQKIFVTKLKQKMFAFKLKLRGRECIECNTG